MERLMEVVSFEVARPFPDCSVSSHSFANCLQYSRLLKESIKFNHGDAISFGVIINEDRKLAYISYCPFKV
jgi:hypothetical protein